MHVVPMYQTPGKVVDEDGKKEPSERLTDTRRFLQLGS